MIPSGCLFDNKLFCENDPNLEVVEPDLTENIIKIEKFNDCSHDGEDWTTCGNRRRFEFTGI